MNPLRPWWEEPPAPILTHAPPLLLNRPALVSAYTVLPLAARNWTGPAGPVSIQVSPPSTPFWVLTDHPIPASAADGHEWVTATAVRNAYCCDARCQLSP